jgi:hypothetical protein
MRDFGVLPNAGGLRDQRAGEVPRMIRLLNVYDAIKAFRRATDWGQFAEDNPEAWATISEVRRMRQA